MESVPAAGTAPAQCIRDCLEVNYREHYAALLRQHPAPPEAIAELYLFRFWLASRACAHARAEPAPCPPLFPTMDGSPSPDAAGLDIEYTLDARWDHLLESRFDLYDRFFQLGRNRDDPLGLDAAALALCCQLFVQPPPDMRRWLREEVRALFSILLAGFTPPPP